MIYVIAFLCSSCCCHHIDTIIISDQRSHIPSFCLLCMCPRPPFSDEGKAGVSLALVGLPSLWGIPGLEKTAKRGEKYESFQFLKFL